MTARAATTAKPEAAPLPSPEPVPLLLTQEQAWRYVGLRRSAWYELRSAGELPDGIEIPGAGLRWRRSDLERWVEKLKPGRRHARRTNG